jgi:hypothetical protein
MFGWPNVITTGLPLSMAVGGFARRGTSKAALDSANVTITQIAFWIDELRLLMGATNLYSYVGDRVLELLYLL